MIAIKYISALFLFFVLARSSTLETDMFLQMPVKILPSTQSNSHLLTTNSNAVEVSNPELIWDGLTQR